MDDDDFDFDEGLLLAVDQYEKHHATASRPGEAGSLHASTSQAGSAGQVQQQGHDRQVLSAVNGPPQQPDGLAKIWGLFCDGPPAPGSTASTGWASRRLQRSNTVNSTVAHNAKVGQHKQQPQCAPPTSQQLLPPQQPPSGARQHPQDNQQQRQWQAQQPLLQTHQPAGSCFQQQPGGWQSCKQQQPSWPQQQVLGPQGSYKQQPTHPCGPAGAGQQQQRPDAPGWQQHQQQQQQQQSWSMQQQPNRWQQEQQQQQHEWQQQRAWQQTQPLQQLQQQQHSSVADMGTVQHQDHNRAAAAQQPPKLHSGEPGSSSAAAASVGSARAAAGETGCSHIQQHSSAGSMAAAGVSGVAASGGPAVAAVVAGPPAAGAAAAAAASGGPAAVSGAGPGLASGGAAGSGAPAASGGPPVLYSARLALGRDRTVEVLFSGFHNQINAVCSSVPGCRKADDTAWCRSWLVPPDKVSALQQALENNLPPNVRVGKFEPLPDLVRNVLAAADKRPDDTALYDSLTQLQLAPGVSLDDRMRPFQREGVKFGLRAGGRLLLGDEMGLGKTVQACALARCYQAEWPVLVVTPSSLRLSWAAALYQWLRVTEDRVLVTLKVNGMLRLAKAPTEQQARSMYDFVIVSYDMLKDVAEVLSAVNFKVVILDESHCIKNPTAQRTKLAKPLVEKAQRAILLSGTPALSNPSELLTQLQALLPKARITKTAFEERYMEVRHYGGFKKTVGSKNGDELNRLLTSTVMIRRKKAEVLKDLPAKNRNQVPLLLDASSRAELDKLKSTLNEVRQLATDMHGVGQNVGGGLLSGMEQQQRTMVMQLWHNTARVKSKAVSDYVKELLLNSGTDDKFLVFAYHRELMDAIEKGINDTRNKNKEFKEMRYMRIDGTTPAKQRDANVNAFQEDHNCRVAILNIKAAGVGLTLTRASTVVFAELAWTPSEVQQAEDRAHRIGQTQSVNVHLLLVRDSIDDLMWELLQSKLATTGQVLDGQAARMEVQNNMQQGRGGTGAHQPQQPSITSFFSQGVGGRAASKKQRTS